MTEARRWFNPRLAAVMLLGAFVSAGMLLWDASRPSARLGGPKIPHFDKLLHFGAHFWLTSLLVWGVVLATRRLCVTRICVAALLTDFALGVAVEYVQKLLGAEHGRVFDWWDVAANTTGALAAVVACWLVARPRENP